MIDTPQIEEPPPLPFAAVEQNDPRTDPPASKEATAILGGLRVGSSLGKWKITALTISSKTEVKDALTVLFKNGEKSFAAWIVPKGKLKSPPPYETKAHAIYGGLLVGTDFIEAGTPLEELVDVIRSVEEGANPAPAPSP